MKKLVIKLISLMLALVILTMTLCSCSGFIARVKNLFNGKDSSSIVPPLTYPSGWTAGGYCIHHEDGGGSIYQEGWWIESYDELMVALNKLESHGSTINNTGIINYDGYVFDVKYCVVVPCSSYDEFAEYKFGDDPFDRCLNNVLVYTAIFFENVTIDQLNYSDVRDYKHCMFYTIGNVDENYRTLPIEEMLYKQGVTSVPQLYENNRDYRMCIYNAKTNVELFYLTHQNPSVCMLDLLTEYIMSLLISSIEYLDFDEQ